MTRSVRILGRAQTDLLEIAAYVRRDAPARAERVLEALLLRIESLAKNPDRGPLPRDERLRALGFRFVVERPHLIFYKVLRSQVRIYRVLHGRRAYFDLL